MVAGAGAARAFLASLAPPERARASFRFAGAERTRWHWTVPSAVPRNGLPLGALTGPQRRLAFALLRTSTSPSGFRKTLDIMALQGLLQRLATVGRLPREEDAGRELVLSVEGSVRRRAIFSSSLSLTT